MLRNVIKKPLRLSKVEPVIKSLHKNGLFVQGFFVMGIQANASKIVLTPRSSSRMSV